MGYIVNGKPHIGKHGISGEMKYMLPTLKDASLSQNISSYFINTIATFDPEAIVFYCMTLTEEEVKKEIENILPPIFMPKMIKVHHCIKYMMLGSLTYATDQNRTFDNFRRISL